MTSNLFNEVRTYFAVVDVETCSEAIAKKLVCFNLKMYDYIRILRFNAPLLMTEGLVLANNVIIGRLKATLIQ